MATVALMLTVMFTSRLLTTAKALLAGTIKRARSRSLLSGFMADSLELNDCFMKKGVGRDARGGNRPGGAGRQRVHDSRERWDGRSRRSMRGMAGPVQY